ncbi:MAG: hypothetical protein JXA82_20085 [Sedimentisphaerales bacterium]|nr:hypothetical protein [Sedimentisphaerales bacterium]
MKIAFLSILTLTSLILVGCSQGESYAQVGYDFTQVEKVAVIDVVGAVKNEGVKNQISDFFVMELLKKGYAPVERQQVQALLNEQDFQASALTSTENAAQAGKLLNVPVVFIINIPNYDEEINMTAKMIDVEDGTILWMGSGTGNTGKTAATILGAVGGAIAGAQMSDSHSGAAGVAGGILGGVAGNVLAPQAAQLIRDMTGKICKTLPKRM